MGAGTIDLDHANIYELVHRRIVAAPESAAFVEGGRKLGYGEFGDLVDTVAANLAALGIAEDDRVAAVVEKSVEALALFFAVMKLGAVYVPVNPTFTEPEREFILGDAEPKLVVVDHADAGAAAGPAERVAGLTGSTSGAPLTMPAGAPSASAFGAGGNACAALLYTSGTTGRPKGARMSHANMSNTFTSISRLWGISVEDRFLHVLPTYHAHGLLMATICPLISGARIALLRKFNLDAVVALVPEATAIMAVPTIWRRLLAHPGFTREAVCNLRLATSGSAPLSPDLFDEMQRQVGIALLDRYGSTEAGMITANSVAAPRRGSVGRPLPRVELRIVEEAGSPVPPETVGRIQARGPHVFLGYWRRADLDHVNFTEDGYFDTGDFGRLDADGCLYVEGRDRDVIISGGFNVYPREVELALEQVAGVEEAAVFGVPHPDFGEGVVAAIRPHADFGLTAAEILSDVKDRLAAYKRPKQVVFVDDLPRNGVGKIVRSELVARFSDVFGGAD